MELNVYKIRFINGGQLMEAIVLGESYEQAERLLKKDYKEYDLEIVIEEYEEINQKGVALTWHEPLQKKESTEDFPGMKTMTTWG